MKIKYKPEKGLPNPMRTRISSNGPQSSKNGSSVAVKGRSSKVKFESTNLNRFFPSSEM